MRILVTGGAGFVGSTTALFLKRKYPKYKVSVFDNLKRRGSELNIPDLRQAGIEFIHGDIRNIEDFGVCDIYDVIIEASAEPSVLAGLNSDPSYVINNNFNGSVNCINQCVKWNAKLIFLSTSRIYPINKIENANITESDTKYSFSKEQSETGISEFGVSESLSISGFRSFYGTTKLATELLIDEYVEFSKLKATVTRFGVIAGPRQMGKSDQGIVSLWIAKHYWGQELKYIGYGGTGKQVRDLLHVDDVVELIDLQIHDDRFLGKVFNVGGGVANSMSLQEMTLLAKEYTGKSIQVNSCFENRPGDLKIYISDNRRIECDFGWTPRRNIRDIFADCSNWIKSNEQILKPFFI